MSVTEYNLFSDDRWEKERGIMRLGGVICTATGKERLLQALRTCREEHKIYGEMKWTKVSNYHLEAYKVWVNILFNDPYARFTSLFVDQKTREWEQFVNAKKRSENHDEVRASVFYQFLLVVFKKLRDTERWFVLPDAGHFSDDKTLQSVEILFNKTYKRAFGPNSSRVIRFSSSLNSHESDINQLADVILGCCSFLGTSYLPCSKARRDLVIYFRERLAIVPNTQRGLERVRIRRWVDPSRFSYKT